MNLQAIDERAKQEAAIFTVAKRIREILDQAESSIELPDGRDPVEEILRLVSDEE